MHDGKCSAGGPQPGRTNGNTLAAERFDPSDPQPLDNQNLPSTRSPDAHRRLAGRSFVEAAEEFGFVAMASVADKLFAAMSSFKGHMSVCEVCRAL